MLLGAYARPIDFACFLSRRRASDRGKRRRGMVHTRSGTSHLPEDRSELTLHD